MIQARIERGRIELDEPIPAEWEGQSVKIMPLTPDDPIADLEQRLIALHTLGPMEYEPGERNEIAAALADLDALSRSAMESLPRVSS